MGLASGRAAASEWSRFSGPNGSGVSAESDAPIIWTERDFLWRVPIPDGYAGRTAIEAMCEDCASGEDSILIAKVLYRGDCPVCGRSVVQPHLYGAGTCSEECRHEQTLRRRREIREIRRGKRTCETCGETFIPKRSDSRYCSGACRQKAYRERRTTASV